MGRITMAAALLAVGCGAQQQASRAGGRTAEEAGAAGAASQCSRLWTPDQTEATINVVEEARALGYTRPEAFQGMAEDFSNKYGANAPAEFPDIYAAYLNGADAILDAVYGPG
ncbi:MAG TPA: hypothetical protein VM243_08910 [Phycisphaerae bacterium]|nr:hypothetical protein [Phycisphaerae bacterium]